MPLPMPPPSGASNKPRKPQSSGLPIPETLNSPESREQIQRPPRPGIPSREVNFPVEKEEQKNIDDPFESINPDEDSFFDDDDDDEGFLPAKTVPSSNPSNKQRSVRVVAPVEEEEEESFFDDSDEYEDDQEDETYDEDVYEDEEYYEDEEDEEDEEPIAKREKPSRSKPSREKPIKVKEEKPRKEKSGFFSKKKNNEEEETEDEVIKPSRSSRHDLKHKKENIKNTSIKPEYTDDTFIDEENLKLEPFGRKTASVSDYDDRSNLRQRASIIRWVTLGMLLVLILLGIKNALIPPPTLSEQDVSTIVAKKVGDTGFPIEKGKGIAEDFMTAYLNVNSDPYAERALAYFYTGQANNQSADLISSSGDFAQQIIYGPTVYSSKATSPTTAMYSIRALVAPAKGGKKSVAKQTDGTDAKMVSFAVNVYYNKETESFVVTRNSPIVIPPVNITPPQVIPKQSALGTGKAVTDDVYQEIYPVINGYIKAFADTSSSDHSAIDPYVTDPKKLSLVSGLSGKYKIAGDDNSIKIEAFASKTEGKVSARVIVNWLDGILGKSNIIYPSSYIITLEKQTSGKYLVSKIMPEVFIPKSSDDTAEKTEE